MIKHQTPEQALEILKAHNGENQNVDLNQKEIRNKENREQGLKHHATSKKIMSS